MCAEHVNYQPLSKLYGAPLRLRVENQLGYKMVKWIKAIEFVARSRLAKGKAARTRTTSISISCRTFRQPSLSKP